MPFDYVIQKRCKVLNVTRASTILLAKDGLCMRVTLSSATEMTDLSSNHEEADTKMILHCANALSASKDSTVILCFPSGDIDINVLATVLLQNARVDYLLHMVQGVTKRDVGLKISY